MAPRLTLLCPTYERHHYLERSCRFWGDRSNVYVFYADGSDTPLKSKSISAKNLLYLYQPISYQQRVLNMLDQVETPYVCMMGDDEFYIPSSLDSCVEFLDTHPDYVACMGRALGFSSRSHCVLFHHQYPLLEGRDLASNLSFSRLTEHFSQYVPAHCYAVTRSDVFRDAMTKALNCNLHIFAISELIEEFIVVTKGKTCVLPELYWLRSHEAPPIRNTGDLSLDPSKCFDHWWLSEETSVVAERLSFCDELALVADGVLTLEEVDSIFECYVKNSYSSQSSLGSRARNAIIKAAKGVVPRPIVNKLKSINSLVSSDDVFKDLSIQGVAIDKAGLAECVAAIEASWNR